MNRNLKRIAKILIILLFFLIFSVLLLSRSGEIQHFQLSSRPEFVGRITVDWRSLADPNDPINCTTTQISGLTHIPICTYGAEEDSPISRDFLIGKHFSASDVGRLLALLRRQPGTTFVDIGANIGSFTLPAARLTSVVAVEPFSRSMARLAKSVEHGRTSGNVTLVNNAISNRRGYVSLAVKNGNLGSNKLVSGAQDCGNSTANCIHTILLDDLLPLVHTRNVIMKVDVESHEALVFTEETASKFFSQLDVKLVFMEWFFVVKQPAEQVESLIAFFISNNYIVLDPTRAKGTNRLFVRDYPKWPWDILFVKREFDAIDLF